MDEKRYIKRKEKARIDKNWESFAIACNNLGDLYNEQGKYLDAVNEYQQKAEVYNKIGNQLEMARAKRMVGEMFMLLCDFDKAKQQIGDYLKTVKNLRNKVEEQRAYATLGRVHLLHGQNLLEVSGSRSLEELNHAEKGFLRSLLLTKELSGCITKLEQFDMQARCYLNLGVVKEHMEKFEDSIMYIERAIKISTTHDLYELTHICYTSLSLLYNYKKNDSVSALRYCNLALEIAKRLPNKVKKICETLITKADILIRVGDFASAKQVLTKAYKKNSPDENDRINIEKNLRIAVKICQIFDELVITNSTDYTNLKRLYEKLGDGCCYLSNYDKALEYYQKMLECAELNNESGKSLVPIYISLYQTYKDNRQYDKALNYLWKEYEMNKDEPVEAFTTLCSIAEVCELQGQPFWTIQDIYQKARLKALEAGKDKNRLLKIVLLRQKKLQLKYGMNSMANDLDEVANNMGIHLAESDNESDIESEFVEQSTSDFAHDICLDNLTDSDTSDLDETDKPRLHRQTRGMRSLTFKRNNKGETPLHQACIAGNLELARRLIEQGHVVNIRDHAGWLPLHEACNHGHREIVELLLDKGALTAINDKGGTSCDGITPLYDACSNGYLQVIELLIERGADPSVRTDYGETCINGLDKWHESVKLTEGEEIHFSQVRTKLVDTLSKIGLYNNDRAYPSLISRTLFEKDDSSNNSDISDEETHLVSKCQGILNSSLSGESGKTSNEISKSIGGLEYRKVMEQLKHPKRVNSSYFKECHSMHSQFKENEVNDFNSLIDDTGPVRKKRCQSGAIKNMASNAVRKSVENIVESIKVPLRNEPEINTLSDVNEIDISERQEQRIKKISVPRSLSSTVTSQDRKKTSFLDNYFSRLHCKSPITISEEDALICVSKSDSTNLLLTSPLKTSPIKTQVAPIVPATISFKVKIENELLLVPVESKNLHEIKIRWLAEEAARRYCNLIGLKPVLRLKTADGFAFEENDSLNVAIEQNIILGTVLEWIISPLMQRYEEMCLQLKKDIDIEVRIAMEKAQNSNSLQLADLWLRSEQTEPIFKALQHQTRLHTIDLSNNFIQNYGCFQLSKSLSTLLQLKILNLKNNFITCEGLQTLLTAGINGLNQIEELNISQNPLGNSCLPLLENYCKSKSAKQLRILHISQCELTDLGTFDLGYHQLDSFDISYNAIITNESIRFFLANLNSCRLQILNLSYITPSVSLGKELNVSVNDNIVSFLESGTCEKFKRIELCGCDVSDNQMYKIVTCLDKAKNLQLLNISENKRLTSSSFLFILDNLPQLRELIATNCSRFVENLRIEKFEPRSQFLHLLKLTFVDNLSTNSNEYEILKNVWFAFWKEKAKLKTYGHQVVFYIDEKDL